MTSRRALGLLALVTGLAYAQTLTAGWAYDDPGWLPLWTHPPAHGSLLSVLLVADRVGRAAPWAYHALIVLVHLANGILFWTLLRRFVTPPAAVLATGLFWLHPLQTESVAYVSGGREVLIAAAVLGALVLGVARTGLWWRLPLAVGLTWLAATAKLSALPVVVLVPFGWWVLDPPRPVRRTALAIAALASWVIAPPLVFWAGVTQPIAFGTHVRFAAVTAAALLRDLALVIWPMGLSVAHGWTAPGWAAAGLVACVVGAWAIVRLGSPRLTLALVWISLPIAARALIPQPFVLAEHHTYLPFLALWPVLATGLVRLPVCTSPRECSIHA